MHKRTAAPARRDAPWQSSAGEIPGALRGELAAAGAHVVGIPNRDYPPPARVLAKAQLVIGSLADLTVARVEQLDDT